ncbi:hypothetical protein VYU27_010652, partial [Nannochloropsis oceanica]
VFAVVFDEFHYMNDPERGTVWEESVILSPPHILFVALSATIANVGQVAGWISTVHGPTQTVLSHFRPVPLKYHFIDNEGMYRLFDDEDAGPGAPQGLTTLVRAPPQGMGGGAGGGGGGGGGRSRRSDREDEEVVMVPSGPGGKKKMAMVRAPQPVNDFL